MDEVRIHTSRRLGVLALLAGTVGLALVLALDDLRRPLFWIVAGALVLSGLLVVLDRRPKLTISQAGVRYSRWGRAPLPWLEFSGYRWLEWRHQPHLQLLARRPSELAAGLSAYGKLNHACYQMLRMPPFSIAVNPLEVDDARLEQVIARYLPAQPLG